MPADEDELYRCYGDGRNSFDEDDRERGTGFDTTDDAMTRSEERLV